jgi:hypothetical protein
VFISAVTKFRILAIRAAVHGINTFIPVFMTALLSLLTSDSPISTEAGERQMKM